MNKHSKSALAVAVAASVGGVPGTADAATFIATLTQVLTYSNNGTAGTAANFSSSTATFSYDDATNLLTQTGGLFNLRLTTSPSTTLYRTSITGLVIGNGGAATATTYLCQEGNFGSGVGSSICGNYSFGANFTNESTTTWGPGTSVAKTIGGDDNNVGAQQSIAGLDGMQETSFVGTTLVLTNRTCTNACTTTAGGFNNGQQWTLNAAPAGAFDDAVNAVSGVAQDINPLSNDLGYADPVTLSIETPPNNGGTAVVVGSPGNIGVVKITYTPSGSFTGTETFQYRAVSGSVDSVATVTATVTAAPDTTPDAFVFNTQTGIALSTVTSSSAATIAGINTAAPISVTNGEYSINSGAFTSTAGTVTVGQNVVVRHTSSATPATDTVTTLTIGGVAGTFTTTTVAADTTPDAFTFASQTNVAPSTVIVSAAAVIGGINAPAAISIANGEYSINGGAYTAAAGTVTSGQSVTVRQTSSAAASTATVATLTIGGVNGTFSVTTAAGGGDLTPDQFTFEDQTNVDRVTLIVSAPVTIEGIDGAAPILVTNGEYSIDGGAYTSVQGTVTNGQEVTVRHTSAATPGSAVTTTLSVGPAGAATRISDAFSSSTRRSGGGSSVDGLILGVLGLLGLARRRNRRS